ncbi:MAG: hypothetical protein H0U97_01110 [Gammaproteobacteria bacterium]|nr:hypothetical protein [Gammaproteobacteria bacterium]
MKAMLGASALLAYLQDESGSETIEPMLDDEYCPCHALTLICKGPAFSPCRGAGDQSVAYR